MIKNTEMSISKEELQQYLGGLWLENKIQAKRIGELEGEIERLNQIVETEIKRAIKGD